MRRPKDAAAKSITVRVRGALFSPTMFATEYMVPQALHARHKDMPKLSQPACIASHHTAKGTAQLHETGCGSDVAPQRGISSSALRALGETDGHEDENQDAAEQKKRVVRAGET